MKDYTIGTIYALKHNDKPYDEAIAEYWSKITGTPIKYYEERELMMIIQNVFLDYIKTSDNPQFEVWSLFDSMRFDYTRLIKSDEEFDKRVRYAICNTLIRTQVRNDNGFVNGFREIDDEVV